MQDDNGLAGVKGLTDQLLGMLGITESRIEYDLRVFGAARYGQRRTLSRGVSTGSKDHTIPAFWRCFSKRPPEQLVTNPSGGRMHGNPVLRPILVVFGEKSGSVVRVQYVAKLAAVLRETVPGSPAVSAGSPR